MSPPPPNNSTLLKTMPQAAGKNIFRGNKSLNSASQLLLKGGFVNFCPKWVINVPKLGMQIYSFWQNSRPLRQKMASLRGIIERAEFVFWLCWKEGIWGKQNQKRHVCTHCYIAALERKIFEAGKLLAKAHTWVFLFWCNFTALWNICVRCCIPTRQRKTFVQSPY